MKKQKDEKCIKKDCERERNDTLKRFYIHEIGVVEREGKRNWVEAMLEKIMLFGSSLPSQTDGPQHNLGEAPAHTRLQLQSSLQGSGPWNAPGKPQPVSLLAPALLPRQWLWHVPRKAQACIHFNFIPPPKSLGTCSLDRDTPT